MASVLQVATIKDQGGNANAIEIANSSANVTVNNLTGGTITSAVNFPAGHVIQVVTGTHSSESFTESMGFTATGISAAITPRNTSSKIFIIASTSGYSNGGTGHVSYYTIYRGSTNLEATTNIGFANIYLGSGAGDDLGSNICISKLDSPNTSNAITYEMRARTSSASHKAYWSMNHSTSNITVMEIAG